MCLSRLNDYSPVFNFGSCAVSFVDYKTGDSLAFPENTILITDNEMSNKYGRSDFRLGLFYDNEKDFVNASAFVDSAKFFKLSFDDYDMIIGNIV